jgi:hypothetical protein
VLPSPGSAPAVAGGVAADAEPVAAAAGSVAAGSVAVAAVAGSGVVPAAANPLGSSPTLDVTGGGGAAASFVLAGAELLSAGPYAFDVTGGGATQLCLKPISPGAVRRVHRVAAVL